MVINDNKYLWKYLIIFFYHWSVYKQIPYTEGLLVNVDKNYVREQKAPKRHLYDLNFFHKVFFLF